MVAMDCNNGMCGVVALVPIAKDFRVLFKRFELGSLLFNSREFNVHAHNFVDLGKLYIFKTWTDGYPIAEPLLLIPSVSF